MKFFVLTNEVGTILGVYGSAIEDMARASGQDLVHKSGCNVALHVVENSAKPRVGQSMSMRGQIEWIAP